MGIVERAATNLERKARTKARQARSDVFVNDGLGTVIPRVRQGFWDVLEKIASGKANEKVTSD